VAADEEEMSVADLKVRLVATSLPAGGPGCLQQQAEAVQTVLLPV
jgi:hypothetical protein